MCSCAVIVSMCIIDSTNLKLVFNNVIEAYYHVVQYGQIAMMQQNQSEFDCSIYVSAT